MNQPEANGREPLTMRPLSQKKTCRVCKQEKPLYEFKADGRSQDRKYHTCSACEAAKDRDDAPASTVNVQSIPITSIPPAASPSVKPHEPQAPEPPRVTLADAKQARLQKAIDEYQQLYEDTADLLLMYERELKYARLELENHELKQRVAALEARGGS